MNILREEDNSWVGVREDFLGRMSGSIECAISKQMHHADVWFFDLDDNHAPSPAKAIAKRAVGTHYLSPQYILWCAGTAFALATKGKAAESERWTRYVNRFLRKEDALQRIREMFSPEQVVPMLYPGVADYVRALQHKHCFYVTRNIAEVADAFAQVLGIPHSFPETMKKEHIVENFVAQHHETLHFGVDGDSDEDAAMIDILRHHKKYVVGVYSMDSKYGHLNQLFDIATSKDRTTLVGLLRTCATPETL